jgi:hypothetical protein
MAELALAETANDNVKFDEQHDNKVAVSPSRPMICSAAV